MKTKLLSLILIFALLSLVPLNALNLETILEDKTLAKEIQNTTEFCVS